MKAIFISVGTFFGVCLIFFGIGIFLYKRLLNRRDTARSAWPDVALQLKKRHDLVPNLVNTVKGYATQEESVIEKVTEAVAIAVQTPSPAKKDQAENMLTEALKSLFAVAEAYPELKANPNFIHLQYQLKDLEDKIEHARRHYNVAVRNYNALMESVISGMLAHMFKFEKEELFGLR